MALRLFIIIFPALLLGCLSHQKANTPTSASKKFLKPEETIHRNISKSRSYISTEIEASFPAPDRIILSAKVLPHQDFLPAEIQWKWPETTTPLAGEAYLVRDLRAGEEIEFQIEFSLETVKDGDSFFFFVYKMKDGERHGTSHNFTYFSSENNRLEQKVHKSQKKPKFIE